MKTHSEYEEFWADVARDFHSSGETPMEYYRRTGILLPIGGAGGTLGEPGSAPSGYNETADLLIRTLDGVDPNDLWDEFSQVLALWNRQRDPLISRLTFTVTEPTEHVPQIVVSEFEDADEFAQPVGIRPSPTYYLMGYDLRYKDLGVRYTWRFIARSTANQLRTIHNSALDADRRLIYRTVMSQLFTNVNRSATLEDTAQSFTVYPFFNGDITALPVAPPQWKSYTHTTTHTHYIQSGGSAVVSGDLDDMYDHIYHHGYAEGADMILLVNRAQAAVIRKFKVASSDSYDFLPAQGTPGSTFLGTLVGNLPGMSGAAGGIGGTGHPGYQGFLGTYGPWLVFVEDMIPAGYMVGFASGGVNSDRNPIGLREHENASLRGLKLIPQFERYPLREAFYHHAIGAGTRHMAAGIVMQIGTGGYTVPTFTMGGPGGR